MTLAHDTTVVADGIKLPIYDLRQPLFTALLSTYLTQIQLLEDAAWSVYVGTMLPAAVGDALDMLGELVGQPRQGRTDEVYRLWINARVRLSTSSGTPVDILEIARAVLPATATMDLVEYFPGAFMLDVLGVLDVTTAQQLGVMLHEAKAAGVRIDFVYSASAAGETFTLGSAAVTPDIDVARGFADVAQTTGGKLAGVV